MKPFPNILFGLILAALSMTLLTGPSSAMEPRTLDGNVYTTILNGESDRLTFKDGLFHSNLYAGRGHDKGEYTTVAEGNKIWFEATTVSPHEGELIWNGVIEGNAINGSYLYTEKGWFIFGDTTRKRNFQGKLEAN